MLPTQCHIFVAPSNRLPHPSPIPLCVVDIQDLVAKQHPTIHIHIGYTCIQSGSQFGVMLRSRQGAGGGTSPRAGISPRGGGTREEPKAEFQGFRLRRTVRDKETSRQRAGESKYDFGVKLKV